MPEFRNMSDIAKYFSGSQQFLGQADLMAILKKEALRLEQYLKEEINNYYQSYTPKVYHRTYDWINSIRVSEPKLEGNMMNIRIYFDDSMAYHPSVISSDQPYGYVPRLLSTGWDIETKVGFHAPMFTQHTGTNYIQNVCDKYRSNNPYGFAVTIVDDFIF